MSTKRHQMIHGWAHGLLENKSYARESVCIEDGVLFSYGHHFPLGVRCGSIDGRPAFLLNSRSYSNTTAKHKRGTEYAVSHGAVLSVPMFAAPWSGCFVREMVEQMERELKAAEADGASRGEVKRGRGLSSAVSLAATAKALPAYLKGAGVKLERSEAARLRKLAKWEPCDREGLAERLKAAKLAEGRRRARIIAKRKREEAERLEKWKAGEGDGYFEQVALRLVGDEVETTKGARVPVEAAKRLWAGWGIGQTLTGKHIGAYVVNEVRADAIVIGCHEIPKAAADEFVRRVGW